MVSNDEIHKRLNEKRDGKPIQNADNSPKEYIGPAQRILNLKTLLDDGIINQKEYELQKARILSEL